MEPTLEELAAQLAHAKHAESTAKAQRIQAEEAIIALVPDLKEKGSTTKDAGNGLSVTITTGLNYKVDLRALSDADSDLACKLAKPQPEKLDVKAYEALEGDEKALAAQFVSVTPKKASVALKVK